MALLFLFVIVWLPFINGLSTEVHQTRRILLLIPIELLIGMKQVNTLLNEGNKGFGGGIMFKKKTVQSASGANEGKKTITD